MAVKVSVLGATGYSGLELVKILLDHDEVEIVSLPSRREDSPRISDVHPQLKSKLDMALVPIDPDAIAREADIVLSALPHVVAKSILAPIIAAGARVVDMSADYRLADPAVYEKWYGEPHGDAEHLADAVYGLPELFADEIRGARLVANPGCYPTGAALAVAPLLHASAVRPAPICIDSKSGVSGAGKKPSERTHFPECNESVEAYSVGTHRHTPEIEQTLGRVAGGDVRVVFVPHLVPMDRGILSTVYATLASPVEQRDVQALFESFYASAPFVRVLPAGTQPRTRDVSGGNYCDIAVVVVDETVVVTSAIDNLVKGAAGQMVQNMNLMMGFDETAGLKNR